MDSTTCDVEESKNDLHISLVSSDGTEKEIASAPNVVVNGHADERKYCSETADPLPPDKSALCQALNLGAISARPLGALSAVEEADDEIPKTSQSENTILSQLGKSSMGLVTAAKDAFVALAESDDLQPTSMTKLLYPGMTTVSGKRIHPGSLSRHQLSLDMKIEVIRMRDEQGLSARKITEILNLQGYKCGKTQVQNILKDRETWIEEYAQNSPLDRKRKLRRTRNEEVNVRVYEWFKEAGNRMIPVNGPALQQKALEVAQELGIEGFKGSNGWLESFRKRHGIVFAKTHSSSNEQISDMILAEGMERPSQPPKDEVDLTRWQFVEKYRHLQRVVACGLLNDGNGSVEEGEPGERFATRQDGSSRNLKAKNGNTEEEEDVAGEENISEVSGDFSQMDPCEDCDTMADKLNLTSIEDVAAVVREIKRFLVRKDYDDNLLNSCLDLEAKVEKECAARERTDKKTTVLDYLNPLDTRPGLNPEQP
ncbi:uncharacterized protein [Diadema setosum]|uniref:uncharacterized protein n=1 Tax=Diadema setosum TaxID=31175 RepID=UPI003B3ABABE